MTEITIVKQTELEERPLSKEERDVLFQELSAQLNIPYDYLKEIGRLEDETIFKQARETKPEILILLIRKILDFENVIPVVRNIKEGMRTVEDIYKEFNIMTKISKKGSNNGGKESKKEKLGKKPKIKPEKDITGELFFLTVQLINPQKTVPLKNLENYLKLSSGERENYSYYSTQNESIEICGLIIEDKEPLLTFYVDQVMGHMKLPGMIRSGNYENFYLWNNVFVPFENKIPDNLGVLKIGKKNINLMNHGSNGLMYILFNSEKQVKQISGIILDYLIYLLKYKLEDYINQFVNLATTFENEGSHLFRKFVEILGIFKEHPIVQVKEEELSSLNISPIKKFIKQIEDENVLTGKFSFNYENSVWFDMISNKALTLLEKALFIYRDKTISKEQKSQYEKDIQDFINKRKQELISLAQNKIYTIKYQESILREMKLRWIYIRKFGFEKFEKIMQQIPYYGNIKSPMIVNIGGTILNYIGQKERDLVELEYRNREKFEETLSKGKFPWINIVDKIKNVSSRSERLKYYKELQKYLPAKRKGSRGDSMIDSSDGYPIICPHWIDRLDLEEKGLRENDILEKLLNGYADNVPLFEAYYCRICGELITHSENMESITLFEGDQPAVLHTLDEGLRDYIWKQANQVVRNFIQFKELTTTKYVNSFISGIVSKLYDFINIIEKKLMKSKTSSIEEIENKKKLFTNIYIYAILIKIILDNYNFITFVKLGGRPFEKVSSDKLLKYALDKITLTQNIVISKLPDVNEAFLDSSLSKALTNIKLVLEKSKLEPPPELDLVSTFALDPIYLYIAYMTTLSLVVKDKVQPKEAYKAKKIYESSYKLTTLFPGSTEKAILASLPNDEYIFQKIISPKFPEKFKESFDNLSNMNLSKLEREAGLKTKDEFLGEFYAGYLIESFEKMMEYIHDQIYNLPVYHVKINKDPERENIYEINVKLDDGLVRFEKGMENLKNGELLLRNLKKYYIMPAYCKLPYLRGYQFPGMSSISSPSKLLFKTFGDHFNKKFNFKLLPLSLGYLSDKNRQVDQFHRHKWQLIVYVQLGKFKGYGSHLYKDSDLLYLTDKDIAESPQNILVKLYNYILIDKICKICLFPQHDLELEIPDPLKIVEKEQNLNNFYNYYENRCPEAPPKIGVHEFDKNEKCKYCGFTRKMYFTKDLKYFNKYVSKFIRGTELKEKMVAESLPINFDVMSNIKKLSYDIPDFITKWKYNSNIINELASKTYDFIQKGSQIKDTIIGPLKVKKSEYYNMLINLGLVEKSDYENIINGSENPYKDLKNSEVLPKTRISKIDAYIKEIIFDYTTLVNYKNLAALPLEIKNIIESADPKEIQSISKLGPISGLGIMGRTDKLDYFTVLRDIRQAYYGDYLSISEFLMEYFCKLILDIFTHLEKNVGKKIAQEFIIYIINKTFLSEKQSSKLKEYKSMLIEATQVVSAVDQVPDHDQSRMYDDLVKANKKTDYEYDFDFSDPGLDSGGYNLEF